MKDTSVLSIYPKTRIKPYDGMSVSAAVWAQAHEEHRQASQSHDLLFHGSGIITGLEVVANDPPDKFVFISPGAAVDPAGNVIILSEPVAYDFGSNTEGTLYLLLGHGEREVGGVDSDIKYTQNEFVVAARSSLPKRPSVELARVTLPKSFTSVNNAANPAHPGQGQLDLRYRNKVGPREQKLLRVGLCNLSNEIADVEKGWDALSREITRATDYRLIVDPGVTLSAELLSYDLVYLFSNAAFDLDDKKTGVLLGYLDNGKAIVAEAFSVGGHESFMALFASLKINPQPLKADDPILAEPFLFSTAPRGYLGSEVYRFGKTVYSTAGYGSAWNGKFQDGNSPRADIRSSHEWGINMIHFLMQ